MSNREIVVAYVGGWLPSVTETFVYKELLAVREEACIVIPCSVRSPKPMESTKALDNLTNEVTTAYSYSNMMRCLLELLLHPISSLSTLSQAVSDSLSGNSILRVTRRSLVFQAFSSLGLARILRLRGVAHIHAHMANTPTSVAMYTAKQLGIGFSFTGHANDLFVHRSCLKEKLQRASFVACISHWHRRLYQSVATLDGERLPIIRCGVDIPPSDGEARRFDPTMDGSKPTFSILSVGRLVDKKGMDTLIRAIAMIDKKHAVRCDIIGEGPMQPVLEKLIDTLQLQDRIFLHGIRPNTEVIEAVDQCDLFVLACQHDAETNDQDGIPVSLMEAMAHSKCVITSDFEPITELVIHEQTGFTVPERNPTALALAAQKLISDSALRSRLADAGRSHVAKEFSSRDNAKKLVACFQRSIEQQRP